MAGARAAQHLKGALCGAFAQFQRPRALLVPFLPGHLSGDPALGGHVAALSR